MQIYAQIIKADDEKRMVYGYASTEALDAQGEIVRKDAIEAALPEYLRWGNIREMHQPSAVGVAKSDESFVDEKGFYLAAKVVDDSAWAKVKEGVYKGFSIGGKALKKADGVISQLRLTEISLVDRPANPECAIELYKAADLPAPIELRQVWTCAYPHHEHLAKAEASACLAATPEDERTEEARIAKRKAMEQGAPDAELAKPEPQGPLKKGMYQVAQLAQLIADLGWLRDMCVLEGEIEQDARDAEQAKRITACCAELVEILGEMVTDEGSEITNPEGAEGVPVLNAERIGNIAKAGGASAQAIHDMTIELGAGCSAAKAETGEDDMQKLDELKADLTKITDENVTLKKALEESAAAIAGLNERIAKLESEPAPAKGVTRAVVIEKADDTGIAEDDPLLKEFSAIDEITDPVQRAVAVTKMIHRHAGTPSHVPQRVGTGG